MTAACSTAWGADAISAARDDDSVSLFKPSKLALALPRNDPDESTGAMGEAKRRVEPEREWASQLGQSLRKLARRYFKWLLKQFDPGSRRILIIAVPSYFGSVCGNHYRQEVENLCKGETVRVVDEASAALVAVLEEDCEQDPGKVQHVVDCGSNTTVRNYDVILKTCVDKGTGCCICDLQICGLAKRMPRPAVRYSRNHVTLAWITGNR